MESDSIHFGFSSFARNFGVDNFYDAKLAKQRMVFLDYKRFCLGKLQLVCEFTASKEEQLSKSFGLQWPNYCIKYTVGIK